MSKKPVYVEEQADILSQALAVLEEQLGRKPSAVHVRALPPDPEIIRSSIQDMLNHGFEFKQALGVNSGVMIIGVKYVPARNRDDDRRVSSPPPESL